MQNNYYKTIAENFGVFQDDDFSDLPRIDIEGRSVNEFLEETRKRDISIILGKAFDKLLVTAETDPKTYMRALGDCYYCGYGTEENTDKAIACYEKAIEAGDIEPVGRLARLYRTSDLEMDEEKVKEYHRKGEECYQKALEAGDDWSQIDKITNQINHSIHSNFEDLLKEIELEKLESDPNISKELLGVVYIALGDRLWDYGNHYRHVIKDAPKASPENLAKAMGYYRKALEAGNFDSVWRAKEILFYYPDPEKDKEYIDTLEVEANKNNVVALRELSSAYFNAHRVARDPKRGFELLKRAFFEGNAYALKDIGNCYQNKIGVEKDDKKAFDIYTLAAGYGINNVWSKLAKCYKKGIGTKIDLEKSKQAKSMALKYFYENIN